MQRWLFVAVGCGRIGVGCGCVWCGCWFGVTKNKGNQRSKTTPHR